MKKRIIRYIGFFVSFVLTLVAYLTWIVRKFPFGLFTEEPSSFVQQWLQSLVGIGILGSGLVIIVALLLLIWKPWKE